MPVYRLNHPLWGGRWPPLIETRRIRTLYLNYVEPKPYPLGHQVVVKTPSVHRLFPRLSCSSPAASDNSFTISYLTNSCGFPPDKAISASKKINMKTPDRADFVIAFFKNQELTETQISHLLWQFPVALTCNPQKILLPKFGLFSSIGLSECDIAKLLTARPHSLARSLKNHIEPTFKLLRYLLHTNYRIGTAIKKYLWILDCDLHATMVPNVHLLQDFGVPRSNVLYILTNVPRSLICSIEKLKKAVEEVVEMGFDPLTTNFILAVHALRSMSKSIWEKKMEIYKKWGLSESQILLAFKTNPWFMTKSKEKIDKVMDYIVNKMGFETSFIAKNPRLFLLSMGKRIIPRSLVYQYCLDNGLIKDKKTPWCQLLDAVFGEYFHQEIGEI